MEIVISTPMMKEISIIMTNSSRLIVIGYPLQLSADVSLMASHSVANLPLLDQISFQLPQLAG
jgi:hypothetical protein